MHDSTETLEYNTQRNHMVISEYGRNIQKMVEYAVAEQDREKRNKLVQALIALMGNLNPHLRDIADYKHKLWDHLFIISNFKLDVDSPYPVPTPETLAAKPNIVPYPKNKIKFRFYGKNVELMIKKATEMEEGPVKVAYINMIGSFMKSACRNWNDEMLDDIQIFSHLEMLSEGKIKLVEGEAIEFKSFENRPQTQTQNPNQNRNKNFKHRNQQNQQNRNQNPNQNRNKNYKQFKKPNRGIL